MKLYLVENAGGSVDNIAYTKMTDARKVQKELREKAATKLDKQCIRVRTVNCTL